MSSSDTVYMCIAAVAIVGLVALAFIFKNPTSESPAVQYNYDKDNKLKSIIPLDSRNIKLTLAEEHL